MKTREFDKQGRAYWKNQAYRSSFILSSVSPHFYRGTQKKVQKGEMERTPFAFLKGTLEEGVDWANYRFSGNLIFNHYRDQDYVWDSPLGKLVISPDAGLPKDAIVLLSVKYDEPHREVYLPC